MFLHELDQGCGLASLLLGEYSACEACGANFAGNENKTQAEVTQYFYSQQVSLF